jgi:hypothetical protein
MPKPYTGGCLCGALRFSADAEPLVVDYCHCELCRRSSGAPVLVWASFDAASFRYTQGTPARFASSAHGRRDFCARCGTQVLFRTTREPGSVDVNVGALDDPARCVPTMHIHCASALPWLDIRDELPRYAGAGPWDAPPD